MIKAFFKPYKFQSKSPTHAWKREL
jgi:hypothetical protein